MNKGYKRRNYFVHKKFQGKFILRLLAVSSAGSQSRRKNGPRDVPARIRTHGMTRFMELNLRRLHCKRELHL